MFAVSIGPWLGTHQRIDQWAAAFLPEQTFPSLSSVLQYEGMGPKAPDGSAILYSSMVTSTASHYYNPTSGEGFAIQRACRYWRELVQELHQPTSDRAARAAAWLAHFATDALSPAHHIGNYVAPPSGLLPGTRYRNWYDPYWDRYPAWLRLAGEHATFELQIVLRTPLNYRPTSFINDLRLVQNEDEIQTLLALHTRKIVALGVFANYVQHGWSSATRDAFLDYILPYQATLVTCLWRSAIALHHSS